MPEYPEPLFTHFTHQKKQAFLAAFAHCGRIRRACTAAGISWKSHYLWLKDDPEYAEAFKQAGDMAGDFLEDEAIRRAAEGVQKPVFYKGEHVDNETIFSDLLLMFVIKGFKPEKYKDRTELSGNPDHPLTVTITDRTREANDRLARVRRAENILALPAGRAATH